MASRAISLIMAVVILACPLWCGAGLVPCCAGEVSAFQADSIRDCGCSCDQSHAIGGDEINGLTAQDHDYPADAPRQHDKCCRGVCGGAVLDKPFAPAVEFQAMLVPLAELSCPTQSSFPESCHANSQIHPISGRALRTLHMSFLC